MWLTYYNGASELPSHSYELDNSRRIIHIQYYYKNSGELRWLVNIFRPDSPNKISFSEYNLEEAKLKSLVKAKEVGWDITNVVN